MPAGAIIPAARSGGTAKGARSCGAGPKSVVRDMPHSGKPDELIDAFGISAKHIVEVVNLIAELPPFGGVTPTISSE